MGKVTWDGWQKSAAGAAQPTAPIVTLRKGSLENYRATPERENEFARRYGSDLVICLTIPPAEAPAPEKPKRRRP